MKKRIKRLEKRMKRLEKRMAAEVSVDIDRTATAIAEKIKTGSLKFYCTAQDISACMEKNRQL